MGASLHRDSVLGHEIKLSLLRVEIARMFRIVHALLTHPTWPWQALYQYSVLILIDVSLSNLYCFSAYYSTGTNPASNLLCHNAMAPLYYPGHRQSRSQQCAQQISLLKI